MKRILIAMCCFFSIVWPSAADSFDPCDPFSASSDLIRTIQIKMKEDNLYTGKIDGIYGWRTENAIKAFSENNGVTPGNIWDPNFLRLILNPEELDIFGRTECHFVEEYDEEDD